MPARAPPRPGRRLCRRAGLLVLLGSLAERCHGEYDPVHHIESARIYGNIDAFAYFYVDLLVGSPPQRVSVILDTGSSVCAFPCAGCEHCGQHIDPAFDFEKSSSARWMPCGGECRGSCNKGHCSYYQGYTEGSSISGFWFQDYVRLGDGFQRNPPVMGRMGCHQNENNLFYTQKANGILGVGPSSRTLFQELFQDHEHVETSIFSICLAEWGGNLVVGGYNQTYHTGSVQYVPLNTGTGYYHVPLTAMKVNGQVVSTNFGTAMVDSGTTYTYMGREPYRALRAAISSYCESHNNCGAKAYGNCWTVEPGEHGLAQFPTVEVVFASVVTTWLPKGYLYRRGSETSWCYSFEDDGPGANTVLGASWMQHKEIVFDMQSNRLGIAEAVCPEARERPAHDPNQVPDPLTAPPPTVEPPTTETTTTTTSTATTTSTPPTTTSTSSATSTTTTETSTLPAAGEEGMTLPQGGSVRTGGGLEPGRAQEGTSSPPAADLGKARRDGGLQWLTRNASPVAAAAVAAALMVTGCMCIAWRTLVRRGEHRHVQLHNEESGMPPQIVGSVVSDSPGLFQPGPETFVIDDGDQGSDEYGFEYVHDVESQSRPETLGSPGPDADDGLLAPHFAGPVTHDGPLD